MTDPTNDAQSLITRQRLWIWISSALVLLSLLVLVFIALIFEVRTTNEFFLLFIYLLEVITATSTGILAGATIGSFKITLEEKLSTNQRVMVQAAGGFAVFLVVIFISPRQQMFNVADAIFSTQIVNCRLAVQDQTPAAESLCRAVAELYPGRPEPLNLLALLKHRTAPLRAADLAEAYEYSLDALKLYGIESDQPADELAADLSDDLSPSQLSMLRDAVYFAAVFGADAGLRAYGYEKTGTREKAISSLKDATRFLTLAQELGRLGAGAEYRIRTAAALGVVQLYEAYLIKRPYREQDEIEVGVFKDAERIFREAIAIDPNRGAWQNYNIFVVTAHRAYAFSDPSAKLAAKQALTQFIKILPGRLQNRSNAAYRDPIKLWLKGIINNERKDPFLVTRPIGGQMIAGKSMAHFFIEHQELKTQLLSVFDSE